MYMMIKQENITLKEDIIFMGKEDKNFLKNKDIIDAGAFTGDTAIPLSEVTSGFSSII